MTRKRRGYILVQALIALAGLSALMVVMAADERAASDEVQAQMQQRRAGQAARAAVARAMAELSSANTNLVTLSDTWAQDGRVGSGMGTYPATESFQLTDTSGAQVGTFRLEIVDAGALINVNSATQQQLALLPLDTDQVDTLMDWRETSTTARSDGAKDPFYNSLDTPYNTKLGPLTTVNELMLVDNWTAQTLYAAPVDLTPANWPTDENGGLVPLASLLTVDSGSPNTQADGTARVNFSTNVNMGTLLGLGINPALATNIAGRSFTSFSQLLALPGMNTNTDQQLLNAATFSTATRQTGKINLNTASQAVLETLPSMTSDLASAIVTQQSSGFSALGQLATVQGMTPQILAQVADDFTVGSDTWIVRAYGQSGNAHVAVEAVVGIRSGQVQVINWERLNATGVPAWWNWNAQTSATVDAGSTT